jgi:hypothetical protein
VSVAADTYGILGYGVDGFDPVLFPTYHTLGDTTFETSNNSLGTGVEHLCGPYMATENGTITSVSCLLFTGADWEHFRYVVYADNGSGKPGALVTQSDESIILPGTAADWVTLPTVAVPLVAGTSYWMGLVCGRTGEPPGLNLKYNGSPTGGTHVEYNNAGTITPDVAPPSTYSIASNIGWQYAVYLTYALPFPSQGKQGQWDVCLRSRGWF